MKKTLLTLFVFLFLFAGFTEAKTTNLDLSSQQYVVTVPIQPGAIFLGPYAYGVNPLYVHAGTWVLWVNYDTMAHSATSSFGWWDTGILLPGQSYEVYFSVLGNYPYYCRVHGSTSMNGQVVVIP